MTNGMWRRTRGNIKDYSNISTAELYRLIARHKRIEKDFTTRITDREKEGTRAASEAARFTPDLIGKRLGWLLEKQRGNRKSAQEELHAREL
jgi:hypothetical protein